MRIIQYLGALLSFGGLAVIAAPTGLSLDVRDEVKDSCGVTTVYVTAPGSIGGGYSMTITRTTYHTAFLTTTVGKSTATDMIEVTVSSALSQSESSAIVTGYAVLQISSGIPNSVEETSTPKETRTIYTATTHTNGDVEVNPVTVAEELYRDVTPVVWSTRTMIESIPSMIPSVITRLTTWTNWHTTTVSTTTTLPNGDDVVTSYTATNDVSATLSMGKKLHDGPATPPSPVPSSEKPEEIFDPEAEVVFVEITRVVEPLITLPPPAEATSTETSISSSEPLESPHAPFPIFTAIPVTTTNAAIIANQGEDEKTTTLRTTTSIIISTTSYTDNADAIETLVASAESPSHILVPSGNVNTPTHTYSGAPTRWNNIYSTMTKVYASAPGYGYDHISHSYSATGPEFTAPAYSSESPVQTGSPVVLTLSVPSYPSVSLTHSDASADPVFSSLLPIESSIVSLTHTTTARFTYGWPDYGIGNPALSWASEPESDGRTTSTGYYKAKSSRDIDSMSKTDAVTTSTAEHADKPTHSSLFSHVVTDIPSYAMPSYGAGRSSLSHSSLSHSSLSHSSLSHSSSGISNATMTSASRDGESSTRLVISVEPTSLEAPSFLIPTITSTGLPPLKSIASELTAELPASIISLWSSLEEFGPPSTSVPVVSVAPTSLVAPSFLIPTVTPSRLPPLESVAPVFTSELPTSIISPSSSSEELGSSSTTRPEINSQPSSLVAPSFLTPSPTSTLAEVLATVVSSSTSSASATSTSCGEQGAFSLNFDDIPPLVGDVDQPLPISSPYKHFYFSEGFAVGPPPRIPFVPDSAPLILQFQTQSDVNVTRNDNFPALGEYGATGEIGNGANLRWGCYSFNAVAASVGCDSLGPDCEWQFTGVTYDPATGDYDEPFTQFARTPGCPAGEGCALTDFVFLNNFENIQSLRVNVTVEGVPKIWWMDDLQLRWSDDSCDAGNCRASHR